MPRVYVCTSSLPLIFLHVHNGYECAHERYRRTSQQRQRNQYYNKRSLRAYYSYPYNDCSNNKGTNWEGGYKRVC